MWSMSTAAGRLEPVCLFDSRTGRIYARTAKRKRQVEFIGRRMSCYVTNTYPQGQGSESVEPPKGQMPPCSHMDHGH